MINSKNENNDENNDKKVNDKNGNNNEIIIKNEMMNCVMFWMNFVFFWFWFLFYLMYENHRCTSVSTCSVMMQNIKNQNQIKKWKN